MIAIFVAQNSHHHWSKTAGTAVNSCHDVRLHFVHNPGTNVAVLSTFIFKFCGAHGEQNIQSHTGLRCVFGGVVPQCPRLGWCVRGRLFWRLSVETRFACCRPDSSQLPMGHTEQPVFAIVPNLVLVQLLGQPPELLLRSLRSRNVEILDTSRSSHRIHVEDASQIGCFWLSALFIAFFSEACTTPTKSLAKYDQVLQLVPFFFPNRSGIAEFCVGARVPKCPGSRLPGCPGAQVPGVPGCCA